MIVNKTNKLILLLVSLLLVLILRSLTLAQQSKSDPAGKAIERSENAADILTNAVDGSSKGISKEIIENAKAIAVFPKVIDAKLLIQQITSGFGVISMRHSGNWSFPAYYSFRGIGYDINIGGGKSSDIILIFMNDTALSLLQKKSIELKGDVRVVLGPIGSMTPEQKAEVASANVIGYTVSGGKIIGKNIKSNFLKGFKISADDNLNKAIYGLSGQEVLSGNQVNNSLIPNSVDKFRQAILQCFIR